MPIQQVMRDLPCRVDETLMAEISADKIYRGQLVLLTGEEHTTPTGPGINKATAHFKVCKMPATEGSLTGFTDEHSRPFGVAITHWPYQDFIPRATVEGETIENKSYATGFLKGMVTVRRKGGAWCKLKVANGDGAALTLVIDDIVGASAKHDGFIDKIVAAAFADNKKVIGRVVSGVYKEFSRSSEQWPSNSIPEPGVGEDDNFGWVYVDLGIPYP
jgi:hypothetical protein